MRVLMLLAVLAANTVFAKAPRRDMFVDDLTPRDCRDKQTMKAAQIRLKSQNIRARKFKKILKFCGHINALPSGPGATPPPAQGEEDPTKMGKRESFTTAIGKDYSICENYRYLQEAAKKYGLTYSVALSTCSHYRRQALLGPGKNYSAEGDSSGVDFALLASQVDQILQKLYIKRNPYITGLRMRFARSLKPGIDPDTPHPFELLEIEEGYPWVCISNEPFAGPSLSGSYVSSQRTVINFSAPLGYRLEDNHGFTYDYLAGTELVGSNENGHTLRSIRLEYFCMKERPADCNRENHEDVILLIEESVKGKGLLSRGLGWIGGLGFNAQEAIYSFLAAKGSRSQTDYLSENARGCKGLHLLTGCEMAVNYFECTADTEDSVNNLMNFRRRLRTQQNKDRKGKDEESTSSDESQNNT